MRAEELAAFCVFTGQSPDVYRSLTRVERDAFIDLAAKMRGADLRAR